MEKFKKSIGVSKLLEESMENTAVLMTLEKRHLMREKIDRLDDIRREEKHKQEDSRIESMLNCFSMYESTGNTKYLSILYDELEDYQEFVKEERVKERYLEELDDLDREKLNDYISNKKKESRDRSFRIEFRIIENQL